MQAQQVPATEVRNKLQSEVEDTGWRGVSNLPTWMTKGDGAAAERVQAEARNGRRIKRPWYASSKRSSGVVEVVEMLVDRTWRDVAVGRVMRLRRLGKEAMDDSEATP